MFVDLLLIIEINSKLIIFNICFFNSKKKKQQLLILIFLLKMMFFPFPIIIKYKNIINIKIVLI